MSWKIFGWFALRLLVSGIAGMLVWCGSAALPLQAQHLEKDLVFNSTAASLYSQAAQQYDRLIADQRNQYTKDDWLKNIAQFNEIASKYPATETAPKARYSLANLLAALYSRNGDNQYREQAFRVYHSFPIYYPDHYLSDDALFEVGKFYYAAQQDKHEALATFESLLQLFPHGDMAGLAAQKIKELQAQLGSVQTANSSTSSLKSSVGKEKTAAAELFSVESYQTDRWSRLVLTFSKPLDVEYSTLQASRDALHQLNFTLLGVRASTKQRIPTIDKKSLIDSVHMLPQKNTQQMQVQVRLKAYQSLKVYDFSADNSYKLVVDITPLSAEQEKNAQKWLTAEVEQPKKPKEKVVPAKKTVPAKKAVVSAQAAPKSASAQTKSASTKTKPASAKTKPASAAKTKTASAQTKSASAKTKTASAQTKSASTKKAVATTNSKTLATDQQEVLDSKNVDNLKPFLLDAKDKAFVPKSVTLSKVLGLKAKRIVLDAGHGGRDPGAVVGKFQEKDFVLNLTKKTAAALKKLLPDVEVLLTRKGDQYLSLSERTNFVRSAKADLFVSIHANSSENKKLRGVETYFLNFNADPYALSVAAKENAASENRIFELQSVLQNLLTENKLQESALFAQVVHQKIISQVQSDHKSATKDLGVKQAPFFVLIGSDIPSILLEVGFISNPKELRLLTQEKYQNSLSLGIATGISNYVAQSNEQLQVVNR